MASYGVMSEMLMLLVDSEPVKSSDSQVSSIKSVAFMLQSSPPKLCFWCTGKTKFRL